MFIIFSPEGIIALIAVALFCIGLVVCGSLYSLFLFIINNWYIALIFSLLVFLIDIIVFRIIKKKILSFEKEEYISNIKQAYFISFLKSIMLFFSFLSFCNFELQNLKTDFFVCIFCALLYIFTIFFTVCFHTGAMFENNSIHMNKYGYIVVTVLFIYAIILLQEISLFVLLLQLIIAFVSFKVAEKMT